MPDNLPIQTSISHNFCMLIEFSVSNFRSFREKQTFSMVAAPRLRKKENVISPVVKGEKVPDLLKVAAVYGPNASGKSNLVKALGVIGSLSFNEVLGDPCIYPFRFDPALVDQPSCFEWHFVCDGLRYSFELAANAERIVRECLTCYPSGKETLLYERQHLPEGYQYQFGPKLEGGELVHRAWQDMTSSRALFIRQATLNSRDDLTQLRIPFDWLSGLKQMDHGHTVQRVNEALQACRDEPRLADLLSEFLRSIDVPVSAIKIEAKGRGSSGAEMFSPMFDSPPKTRLTHSTALGVAEFDLDDESDGTRSLIGFWLPWALFSSRKTVLNSLLVVDELDTSLHPEIVIRLVSQHLQQNDPRQLIFTTHNTHLMDAKLLRRDQFWLTERDMNGATQLYSIHDIEGRESEDIEKRYYEGRYRGLPILRKR